MPGNIPPRRSARPNYRTGLREERRVPQASRTSRMGDCQQRVLSASKSSPSLQDLDCAFDGEVRCERGARVSAQVRISREMSGEPVTAGLRQAKGEAAAIVRVLRTLDQSGANQRLDRPADRRRAAMTAFATSLSVAGSFAAMADSNLRLRVRRVLQAASITHICATPVNRAAIASGVESLPA